MLELVDNLDLESRGVISVRVRIPLLIPLIILCKYDGIGRHTRLKIWRNYFREGSSPSTCT